VPQVPILGPGIPVSWQPAKAYPARRAAAASQSSTEPAQRFIPPRRNFAGCCICPQPPATRRISMNGRLR
jgi:hypothetical protein